MRFWITSMTFFILSLCRLRSCSMQIVKQESELHKRFTVVFDEFPPLETRSSDIENQAGIKEQKTPQFLVDRIRRSAGDTPTEPLALGLSFSEWSTWSTCKSNDCKLEGTQWTTRTCYGTDLQTHQNLSCRYDNLVKFRSCHPQDCDVAKPTKYKWAEWSKWSRCNVSCGRGGLQQRMRSCWAESNALTANNKCVGPRKEERKCQYSRSCPTWDDWTEWSSCSKTCGRGAVAHRARNCIVYKYLVQTLTEKQKLEESSLEENTGTIIFQGDTPIYVLDVARDLYAKNATLLEEDVVKERISFELCSNPTELFEEEKVCSFQVECPSQWSSWGKWSACRRACSPSIKKRERTCTQNARLDPCEGQNVMYRRCHSLPCWGPWLAEGSCSVTCGTGSQVLKRTCRLHSKQLPHDRCNGTSVVFTNCTLQSCVNEGWSEWSLFSRCTASCNKGFQLRNRTCLQKTCHGTTLDLRRCNRQKCPTWSKWGPYSCCNVTCGVGMRSRNRTCLNGKAEELECSGTARQDRVCYQPPCDEVAKAGFDSMPCGTRPSFTLRIAQLRIFMGEKSTPHGWPWQASWQHLYRKSDNWVHVCGVSLIHSRWLVTAAHCILEAKYYIDIADPGPSWSVVLGMHEMHSDGERYFTDKVFLHPDYSLNVVPRNDIALIKLRKMVTFTDYVQPICLPESLDPKPGELCVITGWGFTSPSGNQSKFLLESEVPVVGFNRCSTMGGYYKRYLRESVHMCAGDSVGNKPDSCPDDSGGPLACNGDDRWYLAGVTSFGFAECGAPGHTGIYAPVKHYEKWIREIVEKRTYDTCNRR